MSQTANRTTTGAGVGGSLGALVVWIGPQWGWFTLTTPEEGAMVAAAFGAVFAYLARLLPRPN